MIDQCDLTECDLTQIEIATWGATIGKIHCDSTIFLSPIAILLIDDVHLLVPWKSVLVRKELIMQQMIVNRYMV